MNYLKSLTKYPILLLLIILLFPLALQAQTIQPIANGKWSDESTWQDGIFLDSENDVMIGSIFLLLFREFSRQIDRE